MKKLDEVIKFQILTELTSKAKIIATMTVPEIQAYISHDFKQDISKVTLYKWIKLYNIPFKEQKAKPKPTPLDQLKRTNCRIQTLGIIIRNLCRELDIKHPSILDNLLTGIEAEYGKACNQLNETQALENKIYESI